MAICNGRDGFRGHEPTASLKLREPLLVVQIPEEFPWARAHGLIEALNAILPAEVVPCFRGHEPTASLKPHRAYGVLDRLDEFPWARAHGLIEAALPARAGRARTMFPWARAHGLIEAG